MEEERRDLVGPGRSENKKLQSMMTSTNIFILFISALIFVGIMLFGGRKVYEKSVALIGANIKNSHLESIQEDFPKFAKLVEEDYVNRYENSLGVLAKNSSLEGMNSLIASDSGLRYIYYLDTQSGFRHSLKEGLDEKAYKASILNNKGYKAALKSKKAIWYGPFTDPNGDLVFSLSQSVESPEGVKIGVVGMYMDLGPMAENIQLLNQDRSKDYRLVDKTGRDLLEGEDLGQLDGLTGFLNSDLTSLEPYSFTSDQGDFTTLFARKFENLDLALLATSTDLYPARQAAGIITDLRGNMAYGFFAILGALALTTLVLSLISKKANEKIFQPLRDYEDLDTRLLEEMKDMEYKKEVQELNEIILGFKGQVDLMEEDAQKTREKLLDSTGFLEDFFLLLEARLEDIETKTQEALNTMGQQDQEAAKLKDEILLLNRDLEGLSQTDVDREKNPRRKAQSKKRIRDIENLTRNSKNYFKSVKSDVEVLRENSSKVLKTMLELKDINEKTQLLSLNAAIDALDTGSLGENFALTADEIRQLSEDANSFNQDVSQSLESMVEDIEDLNLRMDYLNRAFNVQSKFSKVLTEDFKKSDLAMDQMESSLEDYRKGLEGIMENKKDILQDLKNLLAYNKSLSSSLDLLGQLPKIEGRKELSQVLEQLRSSYDQLSTGYPDPGQPKKKQISFLDQKDLAREEENKEIKMTLLEDLEEVEE